MTEDELKSILDAHHDWLTDKAKGCRANLRGANLDAAHLSYAHLGRANLRGAHLGGASLRSADLRGANLDGAYLSGADLRGAYLGGAHLSRAYLRGTDLRNADLSGADLANAYFGGADLRDADLNCAHLSGVNSVIALGQPNGWWAFAYLWEGAIWVRVGCRTKSLADGRVYWAGKEDRREVLVALDYAETIARLRGWEYGGVDIGESHAVA